MKVRLVARKAKSISKEIRGIPFKPKVREFLARVGG